MKIINVHTAFGLNMEGAVTRFAKGMHEVEDKIADHWYTKANADEVLPSNPAKVVVASTSTDTAKPDAAK